MFAGSIQLSEGRGVAWEQGRGAVKILSPGCLTRHLAVKRKGQTGRWQGRDMTSGGVYRPVGSFVL